MSKRKNIRQQLRNELYKQHKAGQGRSRHADKQSNGNKTIYNRIYSDLSLKTHLSRIEQFSQWLKTEHPEIRNMEQITPDVAGEYFKNQVEDGKSPYTIGTDMLAVNRVQIGSGNWDNPIKKSDYGLPQRSFEQLRNNHSTIKRTVEQQQEDAKMRERYEAVLMYGQAFGLRRSELVPSDSRQTVAGTNSIYERDNRLYHVTTGKGGRLRVVECLKSHESSIREQYGQHVQPLPDYLQKDHFTKADIDQFKSDWRNGEHFFDSLNRNLRIHVECRQYYANNKLEEIQQEQRVSAIQERESVINGISISQAEVNFVGHQLGHGENRFDVLNRYVGR